MVSKTKISPVVFGGGLNLATAKLDLAPGEAIQLLNYEVDVLGHYTRILGYERFDGLPSPTDVYTIILKYDTLVGEFNIGEVVTGSTSGATGIVCADNNFNPPVPDGYADFYADFYADGLANGTDGYVTLYDVAGTFAVGDLLQVSSVTIATCVALTLDYGDSTEVIHRDNWVVARERRRALIQQVPGSGKIRGVASFNGSVYAFRDDVPGTACNMYMSTVTGWELVTTPALAPGGKYQFEIGNFTGSGTMELLGVDGKNPAFRFDGTTFAQITTGMAVDTPDHLAVLASQVLLLTFGSSLIVSAIGEPTKFSPVDGGGEIAVADYITAISCQPNDTCIIFCKRNTYILYGKSIADFNLTTLSTNSGAAVNSVQSLSNTLYINHRGLSHIFRTQSFGNFDEVPLSQKIEPDLKNYPTRITSSHIIKLKNQYRLFFDDGRGFIMSFNGQEIAGFSNIDYGLVVRCITSHEDNTGKEVVYFGSDDGFVYQAEKGSSFDGVPYISVLRPAFYHYGTPETKKLFKKLTFDVLTPWQSTIQVRADFDHSAIDIPTGSAQEFVAQTLVAKSGQSYWDAARWGEFRWDGNSFFHTDVYIRGTGRTFSPYIYSRSDREPPHSINTMITHYEPRSQRR